LYLSAETLQLYQHLSENSDFREKAASFQGRYRWIQYDFDLVTMSQELKWEFANLSSEDFSGPSEQDEPAMSQDGIPGTIGDPTASQANATNGAAESKPTGSGKQQKRGRRPVQDAEKRSEVIDAWNQFHDSKTGQKKEFCKDKSLTVRELNRYLAWQRT